MMDIHNLNSEEILPEEAYAEYKEGMDFFYGQLARLSLSIYYIDQIVEFPFRLFISRPEEITFFSLVIHNFIEAGLLVIMRVTQDEKEEYPLIKFKNKVRQVIKPEYITLLDKQTLEVSFDAGARALLKQAKRLRDKRNALLDDVDISESSTFLKAIGFSDLKALRDELNALLKALTFNGNYSRRPIQYEPDIEHLLDSVVKNSPLLEIPEKQPEQWADYKATLSDEEFTWLNRYRQKFGLPAVSK
jgi:hypothetical protein